MHSPSEGRGHNEVSRRFPVGFEPEGASNGRGGENEIQVAALQRSGTRSGNDLRLELARNGGGGQVSWCILPVASNNEGRLKVIA